MECYTPCTSTLLVVERDTLHVRTAGVGGGERDTHCKSKLQVVESDTPCMSIVHRRLLMVSFLLHDVEKS
jgi:hypothetical protein